jgi:hypothetical protein
MNRREAIAALTAVTGIPDITKVEVARLQPHDVIVIELDGFVHEEVAAMLKENLERIWPDHQCIILGEGAHLKVVSGVR